MNIEKLLSIASPPLAPVYDSASLSDDLLRTSTRKGELLSLLAQKNGFYAFENALHVLPYWPAQSIQGRVMDIQAWNEPALWRGWYQGLLDGLIFFAEDAFGCQFGIRGEEIVSFDPESGEIEAVATSLNDWAGQLLLNYKTVTGQPVARAWQLVNGEIPQGKRLLPKIPFILGGQFDEENLIAADAVEGMRYRAELWLQLRDLPDGAQIRLNPLPLQ